MMQGSPNSEEARNSESKEASNKEVTPDKEGSKSQLKRLKVMEPYSSKSLDGKKDAEQEIVDEQAKS